MTAAERFLDVFAHCGGGAHIHGRGVKLTGPAALVELGEVIAAELGSELVAALESRQAREYRKRKRERRLARDGESA